MVARSPIKDEMTSILVPTDILNQKKRHSMGMAKELIYSVIPSLSEPVSIFAGIRDSRLTENDWFCYCLSPGIRFTRGGVETPAENNRLLLVYVTDEMELYNWYWSRTDALEIYRPVEYETRFQKILV